MYRPLAGQLRILLCDTWSRKDISLCVNTYPELRVSGLNTVSWSESKTEYLELRQPSGGDARIAQMPLEITVFENGLAIADLMLTNETLVPIAEWSAQTVTFHPTKLTVFDIVRTVADKGGGSHVDASSSRNLRYLVKQTPGGHTYAEMFILGAGRFVQKIGEKLFDYEGVQVPSQLSRGQVQKFNLALAAHREWAEAITNQG